MAKIRYTYTVISYYSEAILILRGCGGATRAKKKIAIWRESAAAVDAKGSVVFCMCVCNRRTAKGGWHGGPQPAGRCAFSTLRRRHIHTNMRSH